MLLTLYFNEKKSTSAAHSLFQGLNNCYISGHAVNAMQDLSHTNVPTMRVCP